MKVKIFGTEREWWAYVLSVVCACWLYARGEISAEVFLAIMTAGGGLFGLSRGMAKGKGKEG